MICTYYNLAIIFCAWNILVNSPQETRGYQEIFQEQSKIEAIECKICIKFSDKLTSLNSWQAQSASLHLIMNNGVYKIDLFDGIKLKSCIIYDGKYFYIDNERWDYKATIFNQHKDKNIDIKLLPWTLVQHFFFPLPVYHERFFVTYSFEQFEKNSNIYELSVNNRIGPSKSPLTEYGDMILYFNTNNRIVASKYKYPDVAFEKGLFSKSNFL